MPKIEIFKVIETLLKEKIIAKGTASFLLLAGMFNIFTLITAMIFSPDSLMLQTSPVLQTLLLIISNMMTAALTFMFATRAKNQDEEN